MRDSLVLSPPTSVETLVFSIPEIAASAPMSETAEQREDLGVAGNQRENVMGKWMSTFVALLFFATACGSSGGSEQVLPAADEEEVAADEPADAEEVAEPEPAEPEPASEEAEAEAVVEPAEFLADAELLTTQFSSLAAGSHRVDNLGTEFSVTIDDDWWVQPNEAGFTVFSDPDNQGPGDKDVVFIRPSNLSDPDEPSAPEADQTGWPVTDIDGWLSGLIDGVVVGDPEEVEIGGRSAVLFDVEFSDDSLCGPEFCVGFAQWRVGSGFAFDPGFHYRVYWVDQGEFEPVAIVVGWPVENVDFVAQADELLATLAFGEPQPHPIPAEGDLWELGFDSDVPAGRVELPVVGGLALELDSERFVVQPTSDFAIVTLGDRPGDVEILRPIGSAVGPIESVDDVLAALPELGADTTELDPVEFAIGSARVFDLTPAEFDATRELLTEEGNERGWRAPSIGRIWLFDTGRGVLMVTAEAGDPETLDEAIALAELLLPTMEFIELEADDG